jgi:pyrimidine-nucleoside phosphorylase
MRSGFVSAIDAERVGKVALSLGAGRGKATDRIDPLAGVRLSVAVGDKVSIGSPLATLEKSSDPDGLEKAAAELFKAFVISPEAPQDEELILGRVD